jgi:hypothetical protein
MNILVTGACGVTSRSVVRSLRMSRKFESCSFVGTDVIYNKYGLYEGLYEKIYRVPWTTDASYRATLKGIIEAEAIDAAIVVPEPEVLYWAEDPFNVPFLPVPPAFARIVFSKERLHEALQRTGLIAEYQLSSREAMGEGEQAIELDFPLWIRDSSDGSTSGKGAFRPENYEQLKAWLSINPELDSFMLSEFLPGRNYGCFLLYKDGGLLKAATTERLAYFMPLVSVSGVTGNASEGRLVNSPIIVSRADTAVRTVCRSTSEVPNGLVVVDLKEDQSGLPKVTEINIRHIATTSSVAAAGCNMSEYQLLCTLDRECELTPELEVQFPANNVFLRDIDGPPVYVEDYRELEIGELMTRDESS